jgi:glutamyl-tRNA synthetase
LNDSPVVGRLAPSPTGAQHVGNARTFLLGWLAIRSRGGRLILRMEDIDSPRTKRGADQQAIDDLRWLGLDWDEGPDVGGPHAPYHQSQRSQHYHEAMEQLRAAERVYPCTCSRSDVSAAASAPHQGQEGPVYPGTCRHRSAADTNSLARDAFCWRMRTTDQTTVFKDQFAKGQTARVSSELGDFVVEKNDGGPAYQLAVVVDDHAMGVTEVLRGDDLLPSTFRQLQLYAFFGWKSPEFAHVPLVVGPDGRRLAKRHGDTRLSLLRQRGQGPERLLGLLAWSCRWLDRPTPLTAPQLLPLFDLSRVPHESFVFTPQMWEWIGGTV